MNDKDLRQAFALMLVVGLENVDSKSVWRMADALVAAQYEEPEQEIGIVAAKPKRRTKSA
jgi:hypothetical protein